MKRRLLFAILLIIVLALIIKYGSANAAPVVYNLPPETATFKPGPHLDDVMNNCTGCHSADYISTQPRGPKFEARFLACRSNQDDQGIWRALDEADIPKIVEYLAATYQRSILRSIAFPRVAAR